MLIKKRYKKPTVGVLPLELEDALLVGSVINFEGGNFTSVGQQVEEVNFSDDQKFDLDWETRPFSE